MPQYWSPILISLEVAVCATAFAFALGLFAAWNAVKLRRTKALLDGLLTLPLVLPPTVIGFFMLMLFGRSGAFGKWLAELDFPIVFHIRGAMIAATVVAFPMMYRTSRGAFESMDRDLIAAARVCGAGETRIFWQIVVPTCRPGILSGTVLTFARALGEFGATAMLAGNIPGRTQTMSLAIYSAVQANERETAYIWVAVITAISFVSLTLINRFESRSVER
ncbi:MAG: molybdate ABC transporter permease subunit [Oscillospiraceae bacterium]|jgi:molybdate transport system permease protein|nr:molybdate ABC transporter permease subunit [Oscillospiraceae bacterium]